MGSILAGNRASRAVLPTSVDTSARPPGSRGGNKGLDGSQRHCSSDGYLSVGFRADDPRRRCPAGGWSLLLAQPSGTLSGANGAAASGHCAEWPVSAARRASFAALGVWPGPRAHSGGVIPDLFPRGMAVGPTNLLAFPGSGR